MSGWQGAEFVASVVEAGVEIATMHAWLEHSTSCSTKWSEQSSLLQIMQAYECMCGSNCIAQHRLVRLSGMQQGAEQGHKLGAVHGGPSMFSARLG